MTCLLALKSFLINSHILPLIFAGYIINLITLPYNLIKTGYNNQFLWVPAYVGISGNFSLINGFVPRANRMFDLAEVSAYNCFIAVSNAVFQPLSAQNKTSLCKQFNYLFEYIISV